MGWVAWLVATRASSSTRRVYFQIWGIPCAVPMLAVLAVLSRVWEKWQELHAITGELYRPSSRSFRPFPRR